MKKLFAAAFLLSAAGLIWLVAQSAQTNSLAPLFPGGALVYVEARDVSALLRDWNASNEKRLWLASSNYEVFSRSRLFLRLQEAQQQFAEAAGFAPDMSLVNSIAGSQAAVAIYDIGELEFLYVTRLPSARVLASTPFAQRAAYESRESAGVTYYVRSGANRRVAAFGTVNGLLFLGTRGDLVANAIALQAGRPAVTPLAQDRWFGDLSRSGANPGQIRIALNMTGLLQTPYFRSYWVQRNASQLRPFSAGLVDLFREPNRIREERLLIRDSQSSAPSEQPVAQVTAWAPADAGLVRAWAAPSSTQILDLIETKLVSPGATSTAESQTAPNAADPDAIAGNPSDLETRIDQPPLEQRRVDTLAPIRPLIEGVNVQAMLHIQSSRPAADGVFLGNDSAIGLLAASDWPAINLPGVSIHRQNRILILASSPAMLQSVVARLGTAASGAGASYTAKYLHAPELGPFTRMMTQMDAAQNEGGGEPRFFSKNVASLGAVLNRVESASITVHDDGARVTQQMVYQLKP